MYSILCCFNKITTKRSVSSVNIKVMKRLAEIITDGLVSDELRNEWGDKVTREKLCNTH